jgi:gliding motility-associated-like protein
MGAKLREMLTKSGIGIAVLAWGVIASSLPSLIRMKPYVLLSTLLVCLLTARANYTCPQMDESRAKAMDAVCGQPSGNISGIIIADGTGTPPFSFQWLNEDDEVIATLPDIFNLPPGTYRLIATDQTGCTDTSRNYTIKNIQLDLPKPEYDDYSIKRNSSVIFVSKNFSAGGMYQLYDAPNGNLIEQNFLAQFTVGPLASDKTYYVRYVVGNCATEFEPIVVKVYDYTNLVVPNAFSPNGDGINDVWLIKAEGLIRSVAVQVFNRYGQTIYKGNPSGMGWDGRLNGSPMTPGTYYWILQAYQEDGKPIRMNGSVTLLR